MRSPEIHFSLLAARLTTFLVGVFVCFIFSIPSEQTLFVADRQHSGIQKRLRFGQTGACPFSLSVHIIIQSSGMQAVPLGAILFSPQCAPFPSDTLDILKKMKSHCAHFSGQMADAAHCLQVVEEKTADGCSSPFSRNLSHNHD